MKKERYKVYDDQILQSRIHQKLGDVVLASSPAVNGDQTRSHSLRKYLNTLNYAHWISSKFLRLVFFFGN